MTARRYTPDQLDHARTVRARHVPAADRQTCAGCGWPYPCPEASRAAFVLVDTAGRHTHRYDLRYALFSERADTSRDDAR